MKRPYRGIIELTCSAGLCQKNVSENVMPQCLNCNMSKIRILDLEGKTLIQAKCKRENISLRKEE